jgi:hypothetical protein
MVFTSDWKIKTFYFNDAQFYAKTPLTFVAALLCEVSLLVWSAQILYSILVIILLTHQLHDMDLLGIVPHAFRTAGRKHTHRRWTGTPFAWPARSVFLSLLLLNLFGFATLAHFNARQIVVDLTHDSYVRVHIFGFVQRGQQNKTEQRRVIECTSLFNNFGRLFQDILADGMVDHIRMGRWYGGVSRAQQIRHLFIVLFIHEWRGISECIVCIMTIISFWPRSPVVLQSSADKSASFAVIGFQQLGRQSDESIGQCGLDGNRQRQLFRFGLVLRIHRQHIRDLNKG